MIEKYRGASFKYAEEIGLCSGLTEEEIDGHYDFICREGWARRVGVAAVSDINDKLVVKQMGLYNAYDQEFLSGGTMIRIEIKCRSYGRTYKWAAISPGKAELIESRSGWILEYYDKLHKWWIWDLSKYRPVFKKNSYRHNKYTADGENNYEVVEGAYYFNRDAATYSGITY